MGEAAGLAGEAGRLLVGITLLNTPEFRSLRPAGRGVTDTASALPAFRRAVGQGLLRWDGGPLDVQVRSADVHEGTAGTLRVRPHPPSNALRCAAWLVAEHGMRLANAPVVIVAGR
jgi:hypothetical protein